MKGGIVTHNQRHLHQTDGSLRTLTATVRRAAAYLGAPVTSNPVDWSRVAEAIQDRMERLAWTQDRLAAESDVSPMTLRHLIHATQDAYRRNTLVKVSTALGWGHDGVDRIGRGEDPQTVEAEVEAANADVDLVPLLTDLAGQLGAVYTELAPLNDRLDDAVTRLERIEERLRDDG